MADAQRAEETPQPNDRCLAELNRLFQLYVHSNLNVRYYGCRAEKYEKRSRYLAIGVGLSSAIALAMLLASEDHLIRTIAVIIAAFAAVCTGVSPFLGWSEKVERFRILHFSYAQIFSQVESVIIEVRRADTLTEQHVGMSRMVHDAYGRLHALDEQEPDKALRDREEIEVRKAFPDNYLWTRF